MPASIFNDMDLIKIVIIGGVIGIVLYFKNQVSHKNKSSNSTNPTQRIDPEPTRTKVEFSGRIIAEDNNLVTAPLSGRKCVLYHIQMGEVDYEDEPYDFDEYFSGDGFFLEDQSGNLALVLLKGAECHYKEKPETISPGSYDTPTLPKPIWQSLVANKHKLADEYIADPILIVDNEVRIAEWCFMPDEQIDILSPAVKTEEAELIKDPETLAKTFAGTYSKQKLSELILRTKMVFKHRESSPLIVYKQPERKFSQQTGKEATDSWGN